ncbi:sushi, von Willebrand factor type A, EGF and pentraxin domain-containing protein 1-like isoform X2 [Acanthaster planci]|uniref:Sushi, von Willebrand factor type A, EGF and pentraxin domain-containing protein 1-like isoform X2 n=1 Tax=Acanthaster planci TaxID=133434 RepID=A0A8B7YJF5_ACAPL|nr:sushi, von Willebrand factor type A, EGF and pentraxin domain-containing protein 1-like isoform X2 [Acanthaster planci]
MAQQSGLDHVDGSRPQRSAVIGIILLLLVAAGSMCMGQDAGVGSSAGQQQQPRLVWTELRIVDRRARIQSLPADPDEYITSSVIASKYYYELTPAHWIAIASDYDDGVAFWSDANHKRIMKGGLRENATASGIFEGTSSTVDGIAVDWLANNVYWTDAAYNWIVVVDYNMTWFHIVVDDGLEKPRGVAVHPQLGYLFWTDWGTRQTIERSTLSGENRTVLADTGLYFPNGITIDYAEDKLYWTDADPSGSRLESSNLDGSNRTTLYSHPPDQGHFFDVTVFQNYIFISDWYNGIRCIRKATGDHYFALNIGGRPFGVTVHGPGVLPGTSSPCDSNPCQQLCVSDPAGFKCLCVEGYVLMPDERSCSLENATTSLAKPQILLAAQNSICYFPSNFPDLSLPRSYQRSCILANRTHMVALGLDVRRKTLFFSDFVNKTIQSVRLVDGASVELVIGGVGSAEGIAVDWLSQNLYWTDSVLDHISVSRYDGSNRRILVKDNVLKARSIAIHAGRRLMFWTEFGPPGQIERASLDGSDRRVILENFNGLNGLSIDFDEDRIYYADRVSGSIQHMDFEGNGRTRLYARDHAQFFDIDLHKDYLLWTEWNTFNGLHAINTENRRIVQSHSVSNETVYGVRVYSDDRQPDSDSVCEDNGGCQHLCLPISTGGMRCECSTGYRLHTDNRACVPALDILYDNFLFASDTYLHSIFQFNVSDPNLPYTALQLDTRTIENPVALAFDPVTAQVYWSDVVQNTIRRAYISNGSQEILFTHEHVETPDGMTIDATSRLLFWTDMGLPSIQVAHLDGSNRKILVRTDIEHPRAILADPGNGLLYWSDWGRVAKIERAWMDGTNRMVLANTSLGWPNGLVLDFQANKLYWCDAQTDKIEVLDLATMARRILVDLGPSAHPFSIALYGPHIYWSDWASKALMRADKATGANNGTAGPADFARLNGLFAYSRQDYSSFSNACIDGLANGGCSSLCLPTPNGRTCACRDGSTLAQDGISCSGIIQCRATFPHGRVQADCQRLPGSTCNVECDTGYQPSDSRISCGPNGFWDVATDSVCEQVQCPNLEVPQQVTVVACLAPHVHGNLCRFRCQAGYRRVGGDEELTCGVDGHWSGTVPTCQAVTCPALQTLPGAIFMPGTCPELASPYNTTCHVLCRQGYLLNGVASHTCQANGEWTDANRQSSCVDVSPPDFGTSCPASFNLTAPSGYEAVNATWPEPQPRDNSGQAPTLSTNVRQPLLLTEGRHSVTYHASDGAGNAAICTFMIEVTVLRCAYLGHPINGYFESCTHHLGSVCVTQCNEGFALHGSRQRVCLREDDGSMVWTGDPASCRLIECDEPDTLPNVLRECTPPYHFMVQCRFSCEVGYERIRGSEQRICMDSAQWSGSDLQCQRTTCPPLVPPEHADITCQSQENFFGDTCTFSCDDGYQLVGIATHRCLANGEWSDNDDGPFCQDIAAPHFNGTCPQDFSLLAPRGKAEAIVRWTQPVVMDNAGNQLNITSSRQPGVTLPEGLHAIVIQASDQAGNQGTCRFVVNITVVRCPLHPFPPFADYLGQRCNNYYGAQCNFSCLVGYQLSGSPSRTCEWSQRAGNPASWTGEQPVCEAVMCQMFDFPEDDMYVVGCDAKAQSLPYGSRCQTVCTEGKQPVPGSGNGQRRCTEQGTWTGENIQCEDVRCPVLTPPPFGIIAPESCTSGLSQFRTMCRYSCMPGFSLIGVSATLCLASGNWSSPEQQACQDIAAPVFNAPCPHIELYLVPDSCTNGHVVTYSPPTAEDNSGTVNVTGGEGDAMGEVWPFGIYERYFMARDPSGNTANCLLTINVLRMQCDPLLPPSHGSIVSQTCGDQSGSVAIFDCNDGYLLIGSKYLACTQEGVWNATVPLCAAVYCSPLIPPVNGTFSPAMCSASSTSYGTTCEISCAAGYGLVGGGTTSCLSNSQWSDDISGSVCTDITPPEITCPPSQSYVLPPGEATMTFTIDHPSATDNSGVAPRIRSTEHGEQNTGPGYFLYTFAAIDAAGNSQYCTTFVTVQDLEAPIVLSCPNATVVETSSLPVTLQWEEPMFDDNVGIRSIQLNPPTVGPILQWGRMEVTYTATDTSDNTNICVVVFEIVQSVECPPLQPPPHGALACENGNYCTMHCNEGYIFLDRNRPRDVYVCLASGRWNHEVGQQGMPYLPACTERTSRMRVRWERTYTFRFQHLQGSCQNQTQQIQNSFILLFMRSHFMYCQRDRENHCKLENIVVTCGDTAESRRRRRQAQPGPGSSMDISSTFAIERNETANIDSILSILNTSISDLWQEDQVTLDLPDGSTAVLNEDQSETGEVKVICGDGTVASGMVCVNCPVGTRYKLSAGTCVPCGKATYQDEEAQQSCKLCPPRTTTIGTGAFESAHCQDMCPPGQISYWGVTPCQRCPLGSYQAQHGQRGCKPCPNGMTTSVTGATSLSLCTASGVPPTVPSADTTTHAIQSALPTVPGGSPGVPGIATLTPTTLPGKPGLPSTTGQADIGILTKKPGKGGDQDNNTDGNKTSPQTANSRIIIIAVVCGVLVLVAVVIVVCLVVRSRRNGPSRRALHRPRPVSWSGSTRAMIGQDDEDDLDDPKNELDLVAIRNPVYGINDDEPCMSQIPKKSHSISH